MVRVVENNATSAIATDNESQSIRDGLSIGQARMLARRSMQVIAVLIKDHPSKVIALLKEFGVALTTSPDHRELIDRVIEAISVNDQIFNDHLGQLIYDNIKGLPRIESLYDSFDIGEVVSNTVGKTASGAMGGGIWGSIIGLASGGLDTFNNATQAKVEKEKAKSLTRSSLIQYQTVKEQNKGLDRSGKTKIILAVLAILGLIGGGLLFYRYTRQSKEMEQWNESTKTA